MPTVTLHEGDALTILETLPSESVHTIITSPPYWGLRDYGVEDQLGLEATPDEYVTRLVTIFREAKRVLRDDGTFWLNLGDSYAGSWGARPRAPHTNAARPDLETKYGTAAPNRNVDGCKPKDLVGIPWRVAFALQADGWYLRSDIIWAKPNPMPESVTDRPTKAHEYLFLLAKSARYYYDADAIKEPATSDHGSGNGFVRPARRSFDGRGSDEPWSLTTHRNRRTVWEVPTRPYPEAHFATFPPDLIRPCVLAGSPQGGTILDPFSGAGTTGLVALQHARHYIGIELNPEYNALARKRLAPLQNQPRLLEAL